MFSINLKSNNGFHNLFNPIIHFFHFKYPFKFSKALNCKMFCMVASEADIIN